MRSNRDGLQQLMRGLNFGLYSPVALAVLPEIERLVNPWYPSIISNSSAGPTPWEEKRALAIGKVGAPRRPWDGYVLVDWWENLRDAAVQSSEAI